MNREVRENEKPEGRLGLRKRRLMRMVREDTSGLEEENGRRRREYKKEDGKKSGMDTKEEIGREKIYV